MMKFCLFFVLFLIGCQESALKEMTIPFENGSVKVKYYTFKGKKQGDFFEYYQDGKLKKKYTFKNDIQEDTALYYFPNGNLAELQILRSGKRNGPIYRYYESGQKELIAHQVDNKFDGVFTKFTLAGDTLLALRYKAGKVIEMIKKNPLLPEIQ